MIERKQQSRWVVLLLAVLLNLFVNGMSFSCMPSLYGEIAKDIPMTYSQWGIVWGIRAFPMMIFTLVGGMAADRAGVRLIVGLAAIFMGVFGIARAFAQEFYQLFWIMFLFGVSTSFLIPNLFKSVGHCFPSGERGLANGFLVAGVCVGSASALMLSGVYLSPLVGGWRNLMWCYGSISILLGVIWLWIIREKSESHFQKPYGAQIKFSFREALFVVSRVRDQWFLMVAQFCILGSLIGVIGFLPEVLVSKGINAGTAHLSSSLIYYANIVGVIAIPILSDKLGLRKVFIWPFSFVAAVLIVSLGMLGGIACLIVCALLGLIVGFIPLLMTLPMEMDGIEQRHFGTALGLVGTIGYFGSFVAPTLGGKLIDITGKDWSAFLLWGLLMAIGAFFILPIKETGYKMKARLVTENPLD